MWPNADLFHHQSSSATLFRDTIKTRPPTSTSTHIDEDPRYRPGITSHSRPTYRRHPRQHVADSHTRPAHHQPPPKHHQHHHHVYPYSQPTIHTNKRHSDSSHTPDCMSDTFVGPLSKEEFIQLTSISLDQSAECNACVALPTYSEPESVFFSVSRPDIPTKDYIKRLVTYTQCSPSAFVLMLIYLDRIANANPRLRVTPYNMHRLLVTALTLACKVLDDRCFSNVHYAKVGGIPTAREMNRLELQFLTYLNYRLHVPVEQYDAKLVSLQSTPPPPPVPDYAQITSPVTAASSLDKDEFSSFTSSETASTVSVSSDPRYATNPRPELSHLTHSNSYPRPAAQTAPVEKSFAWNPGYPPRVEKRSRYDGRRHRADFPPHHMLTDTGP